MTTAPLFYSGSKAVLASLCFALGASCVPVEEGAPAQALFAVAEAGQETEGGFYALPYPNDLRLREDGGLDLTGIIRSNPLLGDYLDAIVLKQRGFGLTSGLFVRFDGAIEPASLPQSPADATAEDASVYLVNIDKDSPEYGQSMPLQFRFETNKGSMIGDNWLSCLPYPGFVMLETTTYALIVSSRLKASDTSPVSAASDFLAVMGDAPAADSRLARAYEIYQPLRDYLDEAGGDERETVVSAAVFTTQAATELMGRFRDFTESMAPAVARELSLSGKSGLFTQFVGRYDSPHFQFGEFPYNSVRKGGGFELDADGNPTLHSINDLRFSLSIPQTEMPASGWPIVLYAHGTGGDYRTYIRNGTAARFAAEGVATISIDQVMHGERLTSGDPETLFFNFLNPLASRGNVMQAASEDFQLARLVEGLDFEAAEGAGSIHFDAEQMYFFGHSQGSVTGIPYVAQSKRMKAAIFSGAGGLLYLSMLSKKLPFDVTALLALIIRDNPLDEFNPALALLQAFYEPADAIVYASLLVRNPPEGVPAKSVFQLLGYTDNFTPVPTIKALATAIGGDVVAPALAPIAGLQLKNREVLTPPIAQNLAGHTAVVAEYDQDPSSDGHFVAFDIERARKQTVGFITTMIETGIASVVPSP